MKPNTAHQNPTPPTLAEMELNYLLRLDTRLIGWYLDSTEPNPLAFSPVRLFRKPLYCLYAQVQGSHNPRVHYCIGKLDKAARYDSDLVYSGECWEDVLDIWGIFAV